MLVDIRDRPGDAITYGAGMGGGVEFSIVRCRPWAILLDWWMDGWMEGGWEGWMDG